MVRSKVTNININPETLSGKNCSEHNIFQKIALPQLNLHTEAK